MDYGGGRFGRSLSKGLVILHAALCRSVRGDQGPDTGQSLSVVLRGLPPGKRASQRA